MWKKCEILTSNFTPLTYVENLENLEGYVRFWISSRCVNSRSAVIFRVKKDLGILLCHYKSMKLTCTMYRHFSIETVPDPFYVKKNPSL